MFQKPMIVMASTLLLLVAACGGSSPQPTASQAPVEPLTLATTPIADFSPAYIAQAAGLFKREGVTVNFNNNGVGANALPLLVSGQVDLIDLPPPTAMLGAKQGVDIKVIYEVEANTGAALISSPKIPTIAALQALPSCRLATVQAGTLVYGLAKQFISSLGLKCDIVVAANVNVVGAGVASGSYDAGVITYSTAYATAAGSKTLNILIGPQEFQSRFDHTGEFPQAVYYGLATNLAAKKESIVRFIRAINLAMAMLHKETPAQLAALLHTDPAWSSIPEATIQQSMTLTIPYLGVGSKPGFISVSAWQTGLQHYVQWGVPAFNPNDPVNSYKSRVDMSYYNQAVKSA